MRAKPVRLLIPKTVSFSIESQKADPRGTKAFVWKGTRMPKGFKAEQKRDFLRDLARESSHYIKRISKRNLEIRQLLAENGIRTEKMVQNLKNGTALFEREGFELGTLRGQELFFSNPSKNGNALLELVSKLIVLRVHHHHLHMGNIAIAENGELILLDLGKATFAKGSPPSPARMLQQVQKEIIPFTLSFVNYLHMREHGKLPTVAQLKQASRLVQSRLIEKMTSELLAQMAKKGKLKK